MADNLLIYNGKAAKIKRIEVDPVQVDIPDELGMTLNDLHQAWDMSDAVKVLGLEAGLYHINNIDVWAPEGPDPIVVTVILEAPGKRVKLEFELKADGDNTPA